MLPAARIQAVIELLATIIMTPKPADGTVSAYFRDRRFIGSKDRAAISGRIFRIMRRWHRLGWWIKQAAGDVNARTLVIADMLFEREQDLASLVRVFSDEKYAPHKLTGYEERVARFMDGKELEPANMPPRVRAECPEWAFDILQGELGAEGFQTEMQAMMTQAPLDLRVNTIKAQRDDVLAQLKHEGLDATAGEISPLCVRVRGRPQISQHPLYMSGAIEIQDQGSQMVAIVADPKPGEQVVDFCAGAGGKTLALGALMNNKGRIVAMDVLEGRLERAKVRFRRAGLHNIETRVLTNERDKWVKRHQQQFDLVLVDAPCTGTGTWRRDPDKRWRMLGPGISELVPLQREILDSAQRLVRPGGRLVYATCSLLADENEKQIENFIAGHPDFSLKGEMLKLTPARDDTDGFFAAALTRKQAVT